MHILMLTNNYKPFLGGVQSSVDLFSSGMRALGHEVLIIAPEFENQKEEKDVLRVPAITNIMNTNFSLALPVPDFIKENLKAFKPDIVHSHHPFLLGDSALRIAADFTIPLVFTFHTMYEKYVHFFKEDSKTLENFIKDLAIGYADMCDCVITPSKSIYNLLKERGVKVPMRVIPTGIDLEKFQNQNKKQLRSKYNIPKDAFVAGFVSRISKEKNMEFLNEVMLHFLQKNINTYFILVGDGKAKASTEKYFKDNNMDARVIFTGALEGDDLLAAYNTFNVFVFASLTETQGLVITESLAASVPVVAVEAPGAKDIIIDGQEGFLSRSDLDDFYNKLQKFYDLSAEEKIVMSQKAKNKAAEFSCKKTALSLEELYKELIENHIKTKKDNSSWENLNKRLKAEMNIMKNFGKSLSYALGEK